jgi:hypothetical protein
VTPMNPQILARALKAASGGDVTELAQLAVVEPAGLAATLRRHQLAGYAWALLRDAGRLEGLPPDVIRPLEQAYASQCQRNPLLLARTQHVAGLLAADGIPAIVLKGAYFAERLQGGLDRRFMWDCDVLVPPARFWDAIDRLLGQGYALTSGALLSRRLTWRHVHSVDFEWEGLGVDLHCRFRHRPGYAIDYGEVWQQRRSFPLAGNEIRVLSDPHELTFLLLSAVHDLEAGRGKLKHFHDLYLLLRDLDAILDWPAFLADRRRERLEPLVLTGLALVLQLFDAGSELPRLSAALAGRLQRRSAPRPGLAAELLSRRRQDPRSRFWFAGLSPGGRVPYLAWWALTVPFRYAAGRKI